MKHNPIEMGAIANVLYLFYDEYDNSPEWHSLITFP
jgi:hypothetical protein